MTPEQARLAALSQNAAAKHYALAHLYRASIERAKAIGKPWADGSYRGPYGNAKDPVSGHHYSPRIRKAAIKAELQARDAYAVARQLMGIDSEA